MTMVVAVMAHPIPAHTQEPSGATPTPETPPPPTTGFQTPGPQPAQTKEMAYVPGEVLVKFKSKAGALSTQNTLRAEGLQTLSVSPESGLMRMQVPEGNEAGAVAALEAQEEVAFAELNYIVTAYGDPNDTWYSQQWALNNTGQTGGTPDADIDAPEAWNIHTGGSHVVIAVLDTGVDRAHEDLQSKIWVNGGEVPSNGIDDDNNGYIDDVNGWDFCNSPDTWTTCSSPHDRFPDDEMGHGTHVSGIAAAAGNNAKGIAGVSWGATIMPVKVLDQWGSGTLASIVEGIDYAVANGADVINMSLAARNSKWPCNWTSVEIALNNAVSQGVLVVIASGNDSKNGVSCPAAYDQAMAVGATTYTDARASYSNYGPRLDITAPGGDWMSSIYSTLPGSNYGGLYGTSMATPYVSGLAALLLSISPGSTQSQVRDMIQSSADDLGPAGWDQEFGHGRINAWRALEPFGLAASPAQISFLVDDDSDPRPASRSINITSASPSDITWTASISPDDGWLAIDPPASGIVSATSSNSVTVMATQPTSYGTHTATLIVTGMNASGATIGPATVEVRISYVPDLYENHFPLIFKNFAP
jgi:subtilisin family serine protease